MENLKVGQSFEVVKIEKEIWLFEGDFDIGSFRVAYIDEWDNYNIINEVNRISVAYDTEVTPVGKLTITKLKC